MRKYLLALTVCASFSLASAQSFYDVNTIQTIKIYFAFSNWDYQMDTAIAGSESYSLADSVVINTTRFTNCGVRFKGNSSYNVSRAKNPLHIKLDHTASQNYQGYQDIKLSNGFSDPSMEREVLSYEILRKYMDAPLSNFAKIYINGTYYGIMTNNEDISCNNFLDNHYFSSSHTFVKCNPKKVSSTSTSSLLYLGTDSSKYDTLYELKSDIAWKDLINFCDTLNNYTASINNILDIDRALWMLAFNNVLVNLDSYTGGFRQNYYLYRNHKNQWIPTIWDLNMSFGGFKNSGSGNLNLAGEQNMSPVLHSADANWPLIKKLLATPMYLHMYIAHMRTINNENFISAQYKTSAAALHTLIDNAVSTDPNYLSTYTSFQNGLTTTSGNSYGIYQVMDTRATYLNSTTQFQQTTPVITNVTSSPSPVFGSNITVTANVTNTTAVYLGYRYVKSDRFVRIQMLDDGAHGDGASGDNVYGISIPANSLDIQYYIYADNSNAGIFSPERAEHEFYTIKPSIAIATSGDIVLNEYQADNQNGIINEDGNHKDWIELYNKTGNPLGLNGLYLSDDLANPLKWKFPANAFIPPNGFLLVWADDKDSTFLDHHTNFNLTSTGDTLLFSNAASVLFDSTSFAFINSDSAMVRCPNGTGSFQITATPSPGSSNTCVLAVNDPSSAEINISVFPNPFSGSVSITGLLPTQKAYILNTFGQTLRQPDAGSFSFDLSSLPSGIYLLLIKDSEGVIASRKLVKQ